MRHKLFTRIFNAICCLTAVCVAIHANAAIECASRPWNAGLFKHGVLFSDKEGIDYDLLTEITERTGCKIHPAEIPRARIWHDIENGTLDISVSGIQTEERSQYAWFIPYLTLKNLVLLSNGVPAAISSPEEFLQRSDLLFGAVRGYKHGKFHDDFLTKLEIQHRVVYFADSVSLFNALKINRVQAVFSQPAVYHSIIKALDFKYNPRIKDWAENEQGIEHGLVLSKKIFTQEDKKEWQLLLGAIVADGTLFKILSKYVPPEEVCLIIVSQCSKRDKLNVSPR